MQLRPYQIEAIRSASASLHAGNNPLIVLPTGTGKSLVIADMTARMVAQGRRVLMLTHVKEWVQQNYSELINLEPMIDAGIYSAGLGAKDSGNAVIFAGVQSYVNHAHESGHFDYFIIDEAHRMPPKGEGQYRKVLAAEQAKNPNIRVIGLTATPYRMGQGLLTEGDTALFNDICYQADFLEMVRDGYLSPVTSYHGMGSADLTDVHTRQGEFIESEATEAFMLVLPQQVNAILHTGKDRKKWLVFAQSVAHAEALHESLSRHVKCGLVHGGLERDSIVDAFKRGELRCIVNVNILTTGFNVPEVDLIALCRATQSVSLYVQIVGRGTRQAPGKTDCLVLDFGGNVERHGPIDKASQRKPGDGVAPMKECPECHVLLPVMQRLCDFCEHDFGPIERSVGKNLENKAKQGGLTSEEPRKLYVDSVVFVPAVASNGIPSITVEYYQDGENRPLVRDYLGIFHPNPGWRAKKWERLNELSHGNAQKFADRAMSVDEICAVLNSAVEDGKLPAPSYIQTLPGKKNPKYKRPLDDVIGVYYD